MKVEGGALTVGRLAKLSGVSPDTIRYYERVGVLPPARRGTNGYRQFSASALQRIALIRRALDAGFSIADLQRVLQVRDRGGAPCRQVLAIAEARLGELEERIALLDRLRRDLRQAIGEWRTRLAGTPDGERAGLLDMWAEGEVVVRRKRRPFGNR